MTVKCIDVKGTSGITKGKEYDVKKSAKGFFHIVNDEKSVLAYDVARFEAVKPVQPTNGYKVPSKGNTLTDIDEIDRLAPPGWTNRTGEKAWDMLGVFVMQKYLMNKYGRLVLSLSEVAIAN